ncbi:MAG: dihydropteroate synthase [Armatimonadetes bacterium]|nr:dihydropteroate synthase [Armatimonadota bacterium]
MPDRPTPAAPWIMGVLNVTPDSFSDGGLFFAHEQAVARGIEMWEQGADIVDVGGESTRPGANPVSEADELHRVVPVVRALVGRGVQVSVDTTKVAVAQACLEAGAWMVNDVTAAASPGMSELVAKHQANLCLMHMRGEPRTMQVDPVYDDVVAEVRAFLVQAAQAAEKNGVAKNKIWIDPGIGFGKTPNHNLQLINGVGRLADTGYPVLVGASRKSFIKAVGAGDAPADRLAATIAAHSVAQRNGASVLRVHDVIEAKRAATLVASLIQAENE